MKKIFLILVFILSSLFLACENKSIPTGSSPVALNRWICFFSNATTKNLRITNIISLLNAFKNTEYTINTIYIGSVDLYLFANDYLELSYIFRHFNGPNSSTHFNNFYNSVLEDKKNLADPADIKLYDTKRQFSISHNK